MFCTKHVAEIKGTVAGDENDHDSLYSMCVCVHWWSYFTYNQSNENRVLGDHTHANNAYVWNEQQCRKYTSINSWFRFGVLLDEVVANSYSQKTQVCAWNLTVSGLQHTYLLPQITKSNGKPSARRGWTNTAHGALHERPWEHNGNKVNNNNAQWLHANRDAWMTKAHVRQLYAGRRV